MYNRCVYLHPAGQPEDDPVFGVHRHAVDQRGPQALVEPGDELRQVLHGLDFSLPRQIDTNTQYAQAAPKSSLDSLSLGANGHTIVHTGRKSASSQRRDVFLPVSYSEVSEATS